jgi:hypothetical protein
MNRGARTFTFLMVPIGEKGSGRQGSAEFCGVFSATVCALTKIIVGPVAAGLEVDGLEGAVDAEGVAGFDLAEHFWWDE